MRDLGKITLCEGSPDSIAVSPVNDYVASGHWVIECEPHVMLRLKRIFAKVRDRDLGRTKLANTDETCRDLLWFSGRYPMEMRDADRAYMEKRAVAHDRRQLDFQEVLSGEIRPRKFDLALPPRDYQRVAAELILRSRGLLVADDLGLGKQQPVDTPVLTPLGWRPIGSIRVGDEVVGSDGRHTRVLGVFPQGTKANYRVFFGDGSSTEAGPDHLWTIQYRAGGRRWIEFVATTDQLRQGDTIEMEWSGNRKTTLDLSKDFKKYIPMLSAPVVFDDRGLLPIPPYTMGQLIANGSLAHGSTTLTTGTVDWHEVKTRLLKEGAPVTSECFYGNTTQATLSGYVGIIREMGMDVRSAQKRIPVVYLRARPLDRIGLLHGLMDADGSCSKTRSRVSYHTTSGGLAEDVRELVEGLGGTGKIHVTDRRREGKPVEYRVNVRAPAGIDPFLLSRKATRYRPSQRRVPRRILRSIEYSRNVESVCIKVEAKDQLYVTEHAILTHNTAMAICALVEPETRPALVVTMTHLQTQWGRELSKFAPDLRWHIVEKSSPYDVSARMRDKIIKSAGMKEVGFVRCPSCRGTGCDHCAFAGRVGKGSDVARQKAWDDWMVTVPPFPDVIITNYHKLSKWAEVLAPKLKMVVFDECLAGDTEVMLWPPAGHSLPIKDFVPGREVTSFTEGGEVVRDRVTAVVSKGSREVWRLTLSDGKNIVCTNNERIWTSVGWVYVQEIIDAAGAEDTREQASAIDRLCSMEVRFLSQDRVRQEKGSDVQPVLQGHTVIGLERFGFQEVWDIETESHHTFFANGIAVHNCQELRRRGPAGSRTAKSLAAEFVSRATEYRVGLSATPFYNYGGEMWNVIDTLQPSALGSRSEFCREWCSHYGYSAVDDKARITDPGAFGRYVREAGLMIRRTRKEVGRELPPLTRVHHHVDSDPGALDEVKDEAEELAKIILRQGEKFVAKGQAARELDWRLRQATGIGKAPYVANFVRMLVESENQVVLYGWHHAVYDVWKSRLREWDPVLYTGQESSKQKDKAREAFITGDSRVMIMSLRSGAGLDGLQECCNTVVFGELDWSPGVIDQCIGRVYRDGQDDGCVAYFLVAEDGSDPVIADTLGLKKQQIDGIKDPDAALIESLDVDPNHIKKLASHFLRSRGVPDPEETHVPT